MEMPQKPQDQVGEQMLALEDDLCRRIKQSTHNEGEFITLNVVAFLAGRQLLRQAWTFSFRSDDTGIRYVEPITVNDFVDDLAETQVIRVPCKLIFGQWSAALARALQDETT